MDRLGKLKLSHGLALSSWQELRKILPTPLMAKEGIRNTSLDGGLGLEVHEGRRGPLGLPVEQPSAALSVC